MRLESRDAIKKENGDYALAPGSTDLYVGAYYTVTKNYLGPSIVFHGEAGLVKARTDPNKTTKPYAAVDVGIGQAEAHAKFSPAGFDVGAGVSLAGGSVSVFVSTSISAPASARPPVLTTTRSR